MDKLSQYIVDKWWFVDHTKTPLPKEGPVITALDRWMLVKLWRKFGYKVGAEIGVSKGKFSKHVCRTIRDVKLYGIDPWDAYDGYVERKGERGQQTLNRHYEEAKGRLAPYDCELIKAYSLDAVKQFEDNSLDFVFIDANHSFEYAVDDMAAWSKKVRPGGIVSGHDYWNSRDGFGALRLPIDDFVRHLTDKEKIAVCQVKDAVDAYTLAYQINPWFVTGADDMSSWFWVKND
jgi:hypothetical protein